MNTLAPALFVATFLTIPVVYVFTHLPLDLWKVDPPHQYPVEYAQKTGEPLTVNLLESQISFTDFISQAGKKEFSRSEVRKNLQDYLEPRLVMYHRTPKKGSGFDTEWKHTSSLLVSKTVKDLVVLTDSEKWTHDMIENVFFKD